MSLTVKHLNGDTTFLLTFTPSEKTTLPSSEKRHVYQPGSFTILVDPWLSGACSMFHPKFLLSKHTVESCIPDLSHVPEPNVVLVSQDKPDHCHEPTLRQLDPASSITSILAEPAACKRIRNMRHFNPDMVHNLRPFSIKNPDSIIRFFIPPIVPGGAPGEATISFIPAKMDVAGVHNAIGVTYRPPSSVSAYSRPFSPDSPPESDTFPFGDQKIAPSHPITPPQSPPPQNESSVYQAPGQLTPTTSTSTSNRSDTFSSTCNQSVSSASSTSAQRPFQNHYRPRPYQSRRTEKTLSFIYSPHGVSYPILYPFISTHLIATAALPLTLLLHSFDRVNNPWWMGGNVAAGFPGGVEIARNLMARCWISAHDEDKVNTGISVRNVTKRKYTLEEVEEMCSKDAIDGGGAGGSGTSVMNLASGQEVVLRS